jgi:hypothetical protein
MTEQSSGSVTEESTGPNEAVEVTGGRYLYCVVDTTTTESETMATRGVGDTAVYVIESETVGAVVHDCEAIYDSEKPEQVKQWILEHQQVVDAAGDIFGTPLPMRFNTILEGGTPSVVQWVDDHRDRIREEVSSLAGSWEYRIRLFWEASPFEREVTDDDERLQELQQRRQQAGSGKEFLLEKQYDKRLRELRQERRAELAARLQKTVQPVVTEMIEQDSSSQLPDNTASIDGDQVARLAVLADKADEAALGERLDELVELDGVTIKFSGPWPPYTFAPDIG